MLYDIPVFSDLIGILQYLETIAPFAEFAVLIIFTVSFMNLLRYGFVKAFAPSISIAFFVSLFLWLSGLLPSFWVEGLLALTGISLILLYFNDG